MNLSQILDTLSAGGAGSGCNPKAGKCGRPKGPGAGKNIEEGDKVVLLAPVKGMDEKKWTSKVYPVGREVRVLKVLPAVGSSPQMVLVKLGKTDSEEHVALKDVMLIKKGDPTTIEVKDAPKSKVKVQYQTTDGAKFTGLKPQAEKEDDQRGRFKPHGLKGKFQEITGHVKVLVDEKTRAQVFFAQPGVAFENQDRLQGTTVFVYRHYGTKTTVIREFNAGVYGHSFRMAKQWEYKNMGAASHFLNARYGIRQKLPKNL